MAINEVRKDYLLKRWVVISKERKRRPTDFFKKEIVEQKGVCPLCPGNEYMTPPAVLVYRSLNGEFKKERDYDNFRHNNWVVRVIPNLYPVFSPPTENEKYQKEKSKLSKAVGHHEIIVESSNHDEHPATARRSQLVHTMNAYVERLVELSTKTYVKHISIFRNHGYRAGASLSHPHSQLITTPFIPTILKEELEASKRYWNKNSECLFCNVLKREGVKPRFIWSNQSFVVFAPWASVNPFEFWIIPKLHHSNMMSMSSVQINDLAETMRICLGGLRSLLNDPPYNFGFHTIIDEDVKDYYHWHLEVYPKLSTWAGFEKSTGIFINTISPEDAAKELRFAVQEQKNDL